MAKLRLTVFDWQNGIWGNRNYYFQTLEEAKKKLKKERGRAKIYNNKNQLIYSEVVTDNGYTNE